MTETTDHCAKGRACGVLGNHTHPDVRGVQRGIAIGSPRSDSNGDRSSSGESTTNTDETLEAELNDWADLAEDAKTLRVTVTVDTDDLRKWAGWHADRGHHGVAHVLYKAASDGEALTAQALREAKADGWDEGVRAVAAVDPRAVHNPHRSPELRPEDPEQCVGIRRGCICRGCLGLPEPRLPDPGRGIER